MPPPCTHAVYRSDCDELWNGMGGLECSFVAFQHINLGHGIDYHPTHVTLTLIDTCNPATLINYTSCMKINALFKLVNDHSVDWYVLYTALLCFLPMNIYHGLYTSICFSHLKYVWKLSSGRKCNCSGFCCIFIKGTPRLCVQSPRILCSRWTRRGLCLGLECRGHIKRLL